MSEINVNHSTIPVTHPIPFLSNLSVNINNTGDSMRTQFEKQIREEIAIVIAKHEKTNIELLCSSVNRHEGRGCHELSHTNPQAYKKRGEGYRDKSLN